MISLTRVAVGIGAAVVLLAGCGVTAATQGGHGGAGHPASTYGTVIGKFLREGGPLRPADRQPVNVALAGKIWFTATGKHPVSVLVGRLGRFSARLPAGSYRVSAQVPSILAASAPAGQAHGGSGIVRWQMRCSAPASVSVAPGRTVHIVVACIVP
jgi:hypothetical protein